jgi:AraC-like DNA-binding protein
MNNVPVLQGNFQSTAELSVAISSNGWEADIRQLDRGPGSARFNTILGPASIFQEVRFERKVQQYVSPIQGFVNFGLLSTSLSETRIGSQTISSSSLLCMHEDSFESVSQPSFQACTLSFEKNRILELAELLQIVLPDAFKSCGGLEFIPDQGRLDQVRSLLAQVSVYAQKFSLPSGHSDEVTSLIESEVLTQLLLFTAGTPGVKLASSRNRALVLRRALAYIEAHPGEALTVEALCRASASSMSTLERAFQEHFGMGPKRYILVQRLHRAHLGLIKEHRDRKVVDIANESGFWHMGKFASDYEALFGYLPSQTKLRAITPT